MLQQEYVPPVPRPFNCLGIVLLPLTLTLARPHPTLTRTRILILIRGEQRGTQISQISMLRRAGRGRGWQTGAGKRERGSRRAGRGLTRSACCGLRRAGAGKRERGRGEQRGTQISMLRRAGRGRGGKQERGNGSGGRGEPGGGSRDQRAVG
jgi:hypothetical protein